MKNYIYPLLIAFCLALLFTSCGPSAEDRRRQEIEDSLKLETDRRQLLEKANSMILSPSDTTDQVAEGDTL